MIKVKDIFDFIGEISPYGIQCSWDNCGLLVGDSEKEVKKIGLCLDASGQTLGSAVENEVDLIITHHPIIFTAQKAFTKGNPAFDAASKGISVISAHTCFDCAEGGINDVLCDLLGIKNAEGVPSEECKVPMARIGNVEETSIEDFATFVSKKLNTVCKVVKCGKVKRVAVCGGSAFDFFNEAVSMGADTYITGEAKHHELLIARDMGINLIVAGHYETEKPAMLVLRDEIAERFSEATVINLEESNPAEFIGK